MTDSSNLEVSVIGINYTSGRKLDKELLNRLVTYEYIWIT